MGEEERREFLVWYETQKSETIGNMRVLETFSEDDVTVLRQTCRVFRRDFMHIGNIEVFLEALTIALACNKILRKRFLQLDTIGLIRTGEYTRNNKYSN